MLCNAAADAIIKPKIQTFKDVCNIFQSVHNNSIYNKYNVNVFESVSVCVFLRFIRFA